MKLITQLLVAVTALASSSVSQAVILEGAFTATIFDSKDFTNLFGKGSGTNLQVGDSISGTIRIDTDLAPTAQTYGPEIAVYSGGTQDWLQVGLTYNGVDLSTYFQPTLQRVDVHYERQEGVPEEYAEVIQEYKVGEYDFHNTRTSENSYSYYMAGIDALFHESGSATSILDGIGLAQNFSWTNDGIFTQDHLGDGSFWLHDYDYRRDVNGNSYDHDYTAYATLDYHVDFMTLHVVNVPEPTAIALFGSGLAGLGFVRRRNSKKAQ